MALGLAAQVVAPAAPPDTEEIERLIQQLGSPAFSKREAASRRLGAIGEPALARLQKAAAESEDAEIRRRARALARAIEARVYTEVRRFEGHTGFVRSVAFSPDGGRALSGGLDGTVRLWDVASGKEVRRFLGHRRVVNSVAFSPDGGRALSGGLDGTVRLWDVATGKELRRFEGHTFAVHSVAFSPDGRQVLSGDGGRGDGGSVRIWDAETGKELRRLMHPKGANVDVAAFSPDGRRVLSASIQLGGGVTDAVLRVWDAEGGKEIHGFREGRNQRTTSAAFSPDGSRILTGSWDRTVRLWDVGSGKSLRQVSAGAYVYAVAFSPDGRRALIGAGDAVYLGGPDPEYRGRGAGTILVWDVESGKERYRFAVPTVGVSLAISPDGRHALSGNHDGTLRLWRLPK